MHTLYKILKLVTCSNVHSYVATELLELEIYSHTYHTQCMPLHGEEAQQ